MVAKERAQEAARAAVAKERAQEVIPYLRRLGFRADEARVAAARCEEIPDASLEERVKRAMSYLAPRSRRCAPVSLGAVAAT